MPTIKPLPVRATLVGAIFFMWLGIAAPPVVQADIYSWTDADGVRHFSNKPPPENVVAARHSEEIPYDALTDQKNQEADKRYFDQRATEGTLRRLAQTERALAESLERAREAERRADDRMQAYDDGYYDDAPYYWGTYYGGDYGGYYGNYDRSRERYRDRRKGRHHRRSKDHHGYRSKGGRHNDDAKDRRLRRHKRISRHRLSKRERGVSSGLTRVVRAIPSPYYMGYRPVYSRDYSYRSGRGGHGRRAHRRGGGGFRSGGRARISF